MHLRHRSRSFPLQDLNEHLRRLSQRAVFLGKVIVSQVRGTLDNNLTDRNLRKRHDRLGKEVWVTRRRCRLPGVFAERDGGGRERAEEGRGGLESEIGPEA